MSPSLPLCADLAWWVEAWLHDDVGLTDVLDRAAHHSPIHSTVAATPGPWSSEGQGLATALIELHDAGAVRAACALPVPARMNGLAGPSSLNRDALEAGEALVLLSPRPGHPVGVLVPHTVGSGTVWNLHHASPRPPADGGHADRTLRQALLAVSNRLAALDVASWSPDTADVLMNLGHAPRLDPPPGIPDAAVRLAARASWLLDVVASAREDGDGGAVSAAEGQARRAALDELDDAARSALVAACSSDAWPD